MKKRNGRARVAAVTTAPTTQPLRIVTSNELAARIGVCRQTLYRWEKQGVLPPRRKRGSHLAGFLSSEVDEFLRSLPVAPGGARKVQAS